MPSIPQGDFVYRDQMQFPAKIIQQIVNQAGTAAPTVTSTLVDNSGVTLTWARTSTGIYTLTASTATFTSGKTFIYLTCGGTATVFKAVVTSPTVLTFTFTDAATPSAADLAGDMSLRVEVFV